MKYFLDKTITLRRSRILDINRSAYSATGTAGGYSACIQEPSPERQQFYEGNIGNVWECYVEEECPAVDGDQVVHNSITYSVKSLKYMDFGVQHYKRLTIIRHSE